MDIGASAVFFALFGGVLPRACPLPRCPYRARQWRGDRGLPRCIGPDLSGQGVKSSGGDGPPPEGSGPQGGDAEYFSCIAFPDLDTEFEKEIGACPDHCLRLDMEIGACQKRKSCRARSNPILSSSQRQGAARLCQASRFGKLPSACSGQAPQAVPGQEGRVVLPGAPARFMDVGGAADGADALGDIGVKGGPPPEGLPPAPTAGQAGSGPQGGFEQTRRGGLGWSGVEGHSCQWPVAGDKRPVASDQGQATGGKRPATREQRPFGFAHRSETSGSKTQGLRGGQEADAGKLPHSISSFIVSGASRECRVPGAECWVQGAAPSRRGVGKCRVSGLDWPGAATRSASLLQAGKLRVALGDSKGEKAGKPARSGAENPATFSGSVDSRVVAS